MPGSITALFGFPLLGFPLAWPPHNHLPASQPVCLPFMAACLSAFLPAHLSNYLSVYVGCGGATGCLAGHLMGIVMLWSINVWPILPLFSAEVIATNIHAIRITLPTVHCVSCLPCSDKVVDKVIKRYPLACIVKTVVKCLLKSATGGGRRLFSLDVEEWLETDAGKQFEKYTGEPTAELPAHASISDLRVCSLRLAACILPVLRTMSCPTPPRYISGGTVTLLHIEPPATGFVKTWFCRCHGKPGQLAN